MTNCLFFAVALFWRRRGQGAGRYILMRGSDLGLTPHFLYAEERRGRLRIASFKPLDARYKALPPPVFAGRVAWGDSKTPYSKDST